MVDMVINSMGGGDSFHDIYAYQIMTLYTLNILQFSCQFYLNKVEKKSIQVFRQVSGKSTES